MPRLNPLPAKKVIRKLKLCGFAETHQRVSHLYLKNTNNNKIVTIPTHGKKDIPI